MKIPSPRALIGYLVAVFIVGLAIGATTGYTLAKKSSPRLPSAQKFEDGWLARYKSELSLTEEQVRAIQPLLPEAVERLGGIWFRAIMTMGAVHESVDRKIEPLLDDQQREKLVRWIKKGREKRLRIARGELGEKEGGQSDLWTAAKKGDLEAIDRHLRDGADVNEHDLGFGLTPLTIAAIHDQAEAVDLLLRKGADVNARHPDGGTALHAAAFFGRLKPVQLLMENGADINARNEEGETPRDSLSADWDTLQFIGAILQVELDREEILAGREAVTEWLGSRGRE